MATYTYELSGIFKSSDRTSTIPLGKVEIDENELSGGGTKQYLLSLARTQFSGKIVKEENRINGELIDIRHSRKGKVSSPTSFSGSPSKGFSSSNYSVGGISIIKVFIGLFLAVFVWMFFYMWLVIKAVCWDSIIKTWSWYKSFIRN